MIISPRGKDCHFIVEKMFHFACAVSELKRWVQQLKDDSANHAEQRGMGTGAIHRTTSDGEDDFIVKRSPALKDFEAFLAVFRAP